MCRTDMLRPEPFYGIQYGNDLRCRNAITHSPLLFIGTYWMRLELGIRSILHFGIQL
jgi:hypothetical protein